MTAAPAVVKPKHALLTKTPAQPRDRVRAALRACVGTLKDRTCAKK